MDFKEFAEGHKKAVYEKICEYVSVKDPADHYRIMRDYVDRQGKYRRPALLLLTANLYGASVKDAILPAAAMQLSEDWILMQDDWEDDSELRRGKPAAHRVYGAIHTINASNTGQMAMWKMLKDYVVKVGTQKGAGLYDKFYEMLEYTVEGQYVENHFIHDVKDVGKAGEDLYFRIIDSKASYYSVYGPLQLGAMVGNGKKKDIEMLKSIGEPAGRAFQIIDDVLDMTADEKTFGKKTFGDLYEGKVTLMILHSYKNATKAEKEKIDAIYRKKRQQKSEGDIMLLREVIEKYGGIDYAKKVAEAYGNKAQSELDKYADSMPDNEYRGIVRSAIEEMYRRKK